jgi:hypothetical protein
MSEHILPVKTATLVAGVTSTLTWSGVEFAKAFFESIIKYERIAIRFSCTSTVNAAVNCGVRYSTLSKDYLVSERKTLFQIPIAGSAEITPASKPALGQMNSHITSISVDCTSLAAGTVTIILIVDDDPPPLSSDPGELIGLDARAGEDYLLFAVNSVLTINPGATQAGSAYTPPAGRRGVVLTAICRLDTTPSFPKLMDALLNVSITGPANDLVYALLHSETENDAIFITQNPNIIVQDSNQIFWSVTNNDVGVRTANTYLVIKESF